MNSVWKSLFLLSGTVAIVSFTTASVCSHAQPEPNNVITPAVHIGFYEKALQYDWEGTDRFVVRDVFVVEGGGIRCTVPQAPRTIKELEVLAGQFQQPREWSIYSKGNKVGEIEAVGADKYERYHSQATQDIADARFDLGFEVVVESDPECVLFAIAAEDANERTNDPEEWTDIVNVGNTGTTMLQNVVGAEHLTADHIDGWEYRHVALNEIRVLRVLRSRFNCLLFSIQFLTKSYILDRATDHDLRTQWIAVPNNSKPKFLGAALSLVEVADVNKDGQSEMFFKRDDHNEQGYLVFWNHFSESLAMEWTLH